MILCIVDMMPYFPTSWVRSLKTEIIKQIKELNVEKDYVMVVEYNNCGKTHYDILNAVRHSGCFYSIITKQYNGGGKEILNECKKVGLHDRHFRLCGVNKSACILETAIDLRRNCKKATIEVSWNGSGDINEDAFIYHLYEDENHLFNRDIRIV